MVGEPQTGAYWLPAPPAPSSFPSLEAARTQGAPADGLWGASCSWDPRAPSTFSLAYLPVPRAGAQQGERGGLERAVPLPLCPPGIRLPQVAPSGETLALARLGLLSKALPAVQAQEGEGVLAWQEHEPPSVLREWG